MSLRAVSTVPSRARIAFFLILPAVLVVLIAVGAALAFLGNIDPAEESTRAGLARVGDDLALVIVTDEFDAAIAAARDFARNWGLRIPALALIPAAGVSWFFAGRVRKTVERSRAEVQMADDERESRLQEIVHELRTPLAVVGTNLELAGGEGDDEVDPRKYIDAARRAADRMTRTVDDLAAYGQLAVDQDAGPADLDLLAESVVSEHVGPGRAKGIDVVVAGSEPIRVRGVDAGAVRTVIGNLLSNAVRLAPKGSAVTVDWGKDGGWAWVAVTDEGPGLPSHQHARAFERGWQGAHDRDRGPEGGSGLGLTIARQLTEAQGGVVTIESEEAGGATFAIWLPLTHDSDRSEIIAADGVHPRARPWQQVSTASQSA